jgi:hypothetical protein
VLASRQHPLDGTCVEGEALRAKLGSYPDPWDAHVFNQILVLSYLDDGEPKITTLTEPF